MTRICLRDGRVIETNDEIMRMPYDDAVAALLEPGSYAATLLVVEDMIDWPAVDKDSYEWKEYSKYFDKICSYVVRVKKNAKIAAI